MGEPKRIQRKRTRGWKMPENAIYVGRPSRWGNPFAISGSVDLGTSLALFREAMTGCWNPSIAKHLSDAEYAIVYAARTDWLSRLNWPFPTGGARYELRGKDLACWCPLDAECHADVLLTLANPPLRAKP